MSATANGTSVTYSYSPLLEEDANTFCNVGPPRSTLSTAEQSLFMRRGDYWVIRYQGQIAFLKATRGLHCLSCLLRHPGREFHVSDLLAQVIGMSLVLNSTKNGTETWQGRCLSDAGPILDAQAKAEYKSRLDDLRKDLEEAEGFNDPARAERARSEIDALGQQLTSAVGLGGRDRRVSAEAERARCTVTKRIKESINKIGEAIPLLGRYLAAQIKTGYFCSYNLSQDHPVAWKFLIFLCALCCDGESYDVI